MPEQALLWEPGTAARENARITAYMDWLARDRGRHFSSYGELWRWSVTDLEEFWESLWAYFDIAGERGWGSVTEGDAMPGVRWFPASRVNYAREALRHARTRPDDTAVIACSEGGVETSLTYEQLASATARTAEGLRQLGVERGDRVAAYLPNTAEALIALLATASLGAVWSVCSPHLDSLAAIDRFTPIEPKVLLAADAHRSAGTTDDLREAVRAIRSALPGLAATVHVPSAAGLELPDTVAWPSLGSQAGPAPPIRAETLPFDHPLWVTYPPGDVPSPVVHSHGGIILEHLKALTFHHDIGPGDVYCWQAPTSHMTWNYLVSGLLAGATVVLYGGSHTYPRAEALWDLAESEKVTYLGVGTRYLADCIGAGVRPGQRFRLDRLRGIAAAGRLLPPESCLWVHEQVKPDLQLGLVAGGTDLCTMLAGPVPLLPSRAGVISARFLGARVESFARQAGQGREAVGELVITRPMPSMPVQLWNDPSGERYRDTYFARYPDAWRQGDRIRILRDGGCVIY